MKDAKRVENLLKKLNIRYKNISYYAEAFYHSSYINENKNIELDNYDRLEFLGDSVLGLITSEYLFNKKPKMSAGELSFYRSKVIRKDFLSSLAKKYGFQNVVYLGNGGFKSLISNSILEDVFESFIGALYLDLGIGAVRKYLNKFFFNEVEKVKLEDLKDYKTKLQEFLQAEKRKPVIYKVISEKKSAKNQILFEVSAIVDGVVLGTGTGTTKKDAEQLAAQQAYDKMVI